MGAPVTPRPSRRDRVRLLLEETADELFRTRGFESTTVSDIALAASMSQRNFFRYFTTKEDVVFLRAGAHLGALRKRVQSRPASEDPYLSIKAALLEYVASLEEVRERALAWMKLVDASEALRVRRAKEADEWVAGLTEELVFRRGAGDDHRRLRLTAAIGVAAFDQATREWTALDGSQSLQELTRECFQALERLLTASPR
jgi:AcrR family transcriptional regulator